MQGADSQITVDGSHTRARNRLVSDLVKWACHCLHFTSMNAGSPVREIGCGGLHAAWATVTHTLEVILLMLHEVHHTQVPHRTASIPN